MLKIRLQRIGKKHQPSFRLIVAERRSKLNGPPIEYLGSYDISSKKANFKKEKIEHWLKAGAQPTITVHNLLVREGIIGGAKLPVKIGKKTKAEAAAPAAAPLAVRPAEKATASAAEPGLSESAPAENENKGGKN